MTWCARCGSERCCPNCGSTYDALDPKIEAVVAAARRVYEARKALEYPNAGPEWVTALREAEGDLDRAIEALDKAEAGDGEGK